MTKKLNTLVFIYNSFNDPLFQNLVLSYIKTLSTKTHGEFHVVTFEQPVYALTSEEMKLVTKDLALSRIYWHPLQFHTGKFLLLKKAWDFIQSLFLILYLRIKYQTKVILAFANVAASISIILKKLLRMKMVVYSYEPHSEFMADLGFWNRTGLKFKILNYLESKAGQDADYIMTGTRYMLEELKSKGSRAQLFRAPTAVDANDFQFRPEERASLRRKLGVESKHVFLYLGKFGGLYYTDELPEMSAAIKREIPNAFFLVVTSNDHAEIAEMYSNFLDAEDYYITGNLTYEEVKEYISAADMGISGVPPSPSQKFRSPTKVAEYLLCGLPYITTRGVSEDDEYAVKYNVGVVFDSFRTELVKDVLPQVQRLFNEDPVVLRERCRQVGLEYRSKEHVDGALLEIYQSIWQASN